jgi:hypothetical protein
VQLMVDFPKPDQVATWRAGEFRWVWTAAFEAFSSDVRQPDGSGERRIQTPEGEYRFVVEGRHRPAAGAKPEPYRLESRTFTVRRWNGITAEDARIDGDGRLSFRPGPVSEHTFGTDRTYRVGPIDYPDAYESPFRYLDGKRRLFTYGYADPAKHQQYCPRCTFRPWADTGTLDVAQVTIRGADGRERVVAAEPAGDGRWRTAEPLAAGESARVEAGGLRDGFGETNGKPSATASR